MRYGDDVYHFLVYYTKLGEKDVEDLVQEVFIKAMGSVHRFQNMSHPKTWLLSIAKNTAIDFIRKQKPIWRLSETFFKQLISKEKSPSEQLEWREDQKELYDLIKKLKSSYREVIILRVMEDLSVADTAEILGWSESKVNLTLHRALKAIQKKRVSGGERYDLLF